MDIVALIPPGWHYPDITRGRILFNGQEYVLEPFEETEWRQTSDILINGKRRGSVEVYYIEEHPELDEGPFLSEERNLIDGIAHTLSEAIERKNAEEELQKAKDDLEIKVKERTSELESTVELLQEEITERKKAEEQVEASLKEKEVLLQEIHHRVKNNMTVITSLLQLQSSRIEEENYKEIFKNSISRIKTMALIHEKLYKSKDLAKVNFNDYIKEMINSMFMSYELSSHKVALKTDVEEVAFGIDTAIPCGLIINELISNSLKYAFQKDRDGELEVSLRRNDKAEFELTVSDNGVGMPEDVDFRNTDSLGLNLVNALVMQLQGKVELYREKGTEFRITFRRRE
jgi:two-component sensor histidine kinase